MFRALFSCLLLALALPCWAQERVESIIEIPYGDLQSIALSAIDFESYSEWTTTPNTLDQTLVDSGANFAATFVGQTVSAQRTDTKASGPLTLTPLTSFNDNDKIAAFNEEDGFRTLPNYTHRSAFLPLVIGGRGRRTANMLIGYVTSAQNKAITSLSPRLQLHNDGSWTDNSAYGIEPIAVLFNEDQTAIGFSLIALHRYKQEPFVGGTMYETLVQIKFFRRDGSLISEIEVEGNQTTQLAFARCGQTVDIAGVQISNSSLTDFAFDDFVFGIPASENDVADNPLKVDLCSFYTS